MNKDEAIAVAVFVVLVFLGSALIFDAVLRLVP